MEDEADAVRTRQLTPWPTNYLSSVLDRQAWIFGVCIKCCQALLTLSQSCLAAHNSSVQVTFSLQCALQENLNFNL
jgi:hypothetical protein